MASKVNNIEHPFITDKVRNVLAELNIFEGAYFLPLLVIARYRLAIGFCHDETVLYLRGTDSYIERTVMLVPADSREKARIDLKQAHYEAKLSVDNLRIFLREFCEKRVHESLFDKRKESSLYRLLSGNTESHRFFDYKLIDTIEPDYLEELEYHLAMVTHSKLFEDDLIKKRELYDIMQQFKQRTAHLSSRIVMLDSDISDEEADLPLLVRRYIPGRFGAKFNVFARSNATLPPLKIIEGFLGHPVGCPVNPLEEQPEHPELNDVPDKRKGTETTVETRPDQVPFAREVRHNCYNQCVITGSGLRQRTEAAHLVDHRSGGIDHYTNGLLLRHDIHDLFDANMIAIHPVTLKVNILPDAMAVDQDLEAYHGEPIKPLRKPINTEFLKHRWQDYLLRSQTEKQA